MSYMLRNGLLEPPTYKHLYSSNCNFAHSHFKGIWVNKSYRYRNPNKDVPQDYAKNQKSYYDLVGLPLKSEEFVTGLKNLVTSNLDILNTNIPKEHKNRRY